ncbi:MAG TPA: ImmA/IrrE family metallo-endopeptidase [Terriglobales bacterium]|jgi:hypothetical protein|nr:ImmA/IrrE family metallo-endopeptidase [Terriglobales bacterium]
MSATLERGFKSWAERTAASLRTELSLSPRERLDPHQLAAYLQVELRTPYDIPGLSAQTKHQLLEVDPSGWSAVTIQKGQTALIIYNPKHSPGRQASDITHELAHLILGHRATTMIMSQDGQMVMRSYDQKQEDEANWLAWVLLLPREGLLYYRKQKRLTAAEIAQSFGVSEQLVSYRLRITGVDAQIRATGRFH